jgi:hypothetical protein
MRWVLDAPGVGVQGSPPPCKTVPFPVYLVPGYLGDIGDDETPASVGDVPVL